MTIGIIAIGFVGLILIGRRISRSRTTHLRNIAEELDDES